MLNDDWIDEDQEEEAKKVFIKYDKDCSGGIDLGELEAMMRELGQEPTEVELRELFEQFDTNCDHQIDMEEFVTLMSNRVKDQGTREEINQAFKFFDSDGDNSISKEDLIILMKKLGEELKEEEIEDMIRVADTTKDGKISFDEFSKVLEIE